MTDQVNNAEPTEAQPDSHPQSSSRRKFLRESAALTGGSVLAAAAPAALAEPLPIPTSNKFLGRGVVSVPYGKPSKFEGDILRRNVEWLTPDTIASISFSPIQDLHGIITPGGLHFERYHGGCPDVDPNQHLLVIHGKVKNPLKLTREDLRRFPQHTGIHFLECPANGGMEWKGVQMDSIQFTHGMLSCSEWTGVKLTTLMEAAGVDPDATWMLAEGGDASAMTRSLPLPGAKDQYGQEIPDGMEMLKDAMVVYAQNGEPLRPEQGHPIRLMIPGMEANVSVKWLRRLKFGDAPWVHREENSRYTDLMPDGKARQFSFYQEANSVITYPCPDKRVKQHGFQEIRGLAWSGRGKITHVDVSVDGGKNWREAKLMDPVLPKALTRFTIPWEWNGEESLLVSRAVDETGYVQPTLKQLRDARGTNNIYHKNSQQVWRVMPDGEVKNVQIVNV